MISADNKAANTGLLLMDFSSNQEANLWKVVNDSVMGGVSNSDLIIKQSVGQFSGHLSTRNNGGFASIGRSLQEFDLTGLEHIKIRIKGDGRKYQLRLRTSQNWHGEGYKVSFTTVADQWRTLHFHQPQFVATYRGKLVSHAAPLVFSEVQQLGFLIADNTDGDFKLEIDWVVMG